MILLQNEECEEQCFYELLRSKQTCDNVIDPKRLYCSLFSLCSMEL